MSALNIVPSSHADLLEGPNVNVLVTMLPDGMPQSTAVWSKFDGDYIYVSTIEGSRKEKNVRENHKVNVLTFDPGNPYRYIEVRGEIIDIAMDSNCKLIDELSALYVGKSPYYGAFMPAEQGDTEQRIILKIKPVKINTMG